MGIMQTLTGMFGQRTSRQPLVAINLKPMPRPWGGGNQFLIQLVTSLEKSGCQVTYSPRHIARLLVIVMARSDCPSTFHLHKIRKLRKRGIPCLVRINECDHRKKTDYVDDALYRVAMEADSVVFISHWLETYFKARWPTFPTRTLVIGNAADDAIFFPSEPRLPKNGEPWRIVTHHWSDHAMKGWPLYYDIDAMIADGRLPGFALTVIGNSPANLRWKSARVLPPLWGRDLADELRRHHLYLTASLHEPGGMHHIEGAQCGLPLVYHEDGGGIVEYGRRYGIGFRDDPAEALRQAAENYGILRERVLKLAPSGASMCAAYLEECRFLMQGPGMIRNE